MLFLFILNLLFCLFNLKIGQYGWALCNLGALVAIAIHFTFDADDEGKNE